MLRQRRKIDVFAVIASKFFAKRGKRGIRRRLPHFSLPVFLDSTRLKSRRRKPEVNPRFHHARAHANVFDSSHDCCPADRRNHAAPAADGDDAPGKVVGPVRGRAQVAIEVLRLFARQIARSQPSTGRQSQWQLPQFFSIRRQN